MEMNATDIHIQVGLPSMCRVRGKLVPAGGGVGRPDSGGWG